MINHPHITGELASQHQLEMRASAAHNRAIASAKAAKKSAKPRRHTSRLIARVAATFAHQLHTPASITHSAETAPTEAVA